MSSKNDLSNSVTMDELKHQEQQANYLATDLSQFETPEVQKMLDILKSEQYRSGLKEGERKVLEMDYDELIKEYNLIVDKKSNESAANRNRVMQVILRLLKDNRIFMNEQGYAEPVRNGTT
jgi:hypothetical protein